METTKIILLLFEIFLLVCLFPVTCQTRACRAQKEKNGGGGGKGKGFGHGFIDFTSEVFTNYGL